MSTDLYPGYPPRETRRRQQRGGYWYAWANSTFSTTVITLFLGPYLTDLAEQSADPDGFVSVLGFGVRATSVFAFAAGVSVLLQVVVLPVVGAIADRTGRKRLLLGIFAYTGATMTMLMVLLVDDTWALGVTLLIVANLAFGSSIVVYNAFLPDIATPDERDGVSSRGWAMGYVGGALLLVLNLAFYLSRESLGVSTSTAVRVCLFSAGLWWALFTLVPLRALRDVAPAASANPEATVSSAFAQLGRTLRGLRRTPMTLRFLVAYLIYNDGVQTVIVLASVYGSEELGFGDQTLIVAVLIVQVVAIAGALALGRLAGRFGAKRVVLGSLVVWAAIVAVAFVLPAGRASLFYLLAVVIGFVLGGSQALSRSLFSQMVPDGREAEYFGLYEISERGTSWIGPIVFGVVDQVTGSYRLAILALLAFFIVGGGLLSRVDVRRAVGEAGNEAPAVV